MNKCKDSLRTKFEYKYLFYTLSFLSLNLGICNEYIKRKRIEHKDEKVKIYFDLTEKNLEIIDRKKYFKRVQKICEGFNFPISSISEAANNYFPLDYHLQYLSDAFEKKKNDLKSMVESVSKGKHRLVDKEMEVMIIDRMVDEVINYLLICNDKMKDNKSSWTFLRSIEWEHLKEYIIKRKRINVKSSSDFLNTFIDEMYAYIYLYLLINYKRNNFFDFMKVKRSYRHCSENVGKDIGLEVGNYLHINSQGIVNNSSFYIDNNEGNESRNHDDISIYGREAENPQVVDKAEYVLNMKTLREIHNCLSTYGVVVLKNFLPKESVDMIKRELFLEKEDMNISSFLMNKDQNVYCLRPTRGRQYCILRNSRISDTFVNIQQYWMNIIYSYLPVGLYENIFHLFDKDVLLKLNKINSLHIKTEQTDKIFLSELQLLNNEPLSETQSYHVDNGLSGISVILPLSTINMESGNFEFFIGTHLFSSFKKKKIKEKILTFKKFMNIYYKTGSSFIPTVSERDLIIYDSRILHRGLSNNLWVKNSSLIYRYDYKKYPAPGQDFIDIFSYIVIGKCISTFNLLGKYL
ncbi:hypothetical protein MKS88_001681 [Plasmodium brasilianum]|uniref:Phytanoyl-CoA dioxygenase n=2 Tax=Plasmodium (Plasmodium) TaxID=418103 RepID=A0A1D3JK00_PLAMA|nr:conserved Plasmodium protein, unknown function [Plasmodium malariae]KAI4839779.1 hypothetical protein MKS88_001681 [Plasmodium brasilianum]SBT86723.1 conserved Plasmodium protein, unknown function [Plasmodium malariae]